jgi:glycerol-3-phosphate acyltransferase PlsX
MKIAVDAMGGDYAPQAIVEGAVQAAREYGMSLILVGIEEVVRRELEKYDTRGLNIEIRHASQVVDMHDLPAVALRRKPDSSIRVAVNLIRDGIVDAVVSAGNTGASMAIAKIVCGTLEGVERPAIAAVIPNLNRATILLDVGANVDSKPRHILQFAVMGHVYAKDIINVEKPRIGLLSIGEESSKGNELTKEVFEALRRTELNFIGNVEGRDIFNGKVDVVVCDGFVGNIVLKVTESFAETMGVVLKEEFSKSLRTKLGYLLIKPEILRLKRKMDYAEYGGAPLLGINGVLIKAHGSSKAKAIKNAIRVAGESIHQQIKTHITETIAKYQFNYPDPIRRRVKVKKSFKDSHRPDESYEKREVQEEWPKHMDPKSPEEKEKKENKPS